MISLFIVFAFLSSVAAQVAVPLQHVAIARNDASINSGNTNILTNNRDLYFVGNITIGTPPQTFSIQYDTGSAILWVTSSDCYNQYCHYHNRFSSSDSSTFTTTIMPFNETYEDGSNAYGYIGVDTVTIGGISIVDQQFGIATSENYGFEPHVDGLLGLGKFNPDGSAEENSAYIEPLQSMYNQNLISKRLFSVALHTLGSSTGGEVLFGDINPLEYTGDITYLPLATNYYSDTPSYWAIHLDSITVNGVSVNNNNNNDRIITAVVDTGSSYLFIPQRVSDTFFCNINAYVDQVFGLPWIDCDTFNNMTITFGANEYTLPLPPEYWIVQTNSSDQFVHAAKTDSNIPPYLSEDRPIYCYAKVSAVDGESQWILGVPFLQYYYTVFDFDNAQIGFAPQAGTILNGSTTITSDSSVETDAAAETVSNSSNGRISMNLELSLMLMVMVMIMWRI